MKKNIFLFFGCLVLILAIGASQKAFAHDLGIINEDGKTIYYKWNNDKTELMVTFEGAIYYSYTNEYSGNIIIPSSVTYNGANYSVTSIGNEAFRDCSGLTSVTIPSSVKNIGDYAFYGCKGLTNVTIPEGVTSIGQYAFRDCSGLTSVTIPSSVTSIGKQAFCGSGLTSVTIPEGVTSIGQDAFRGCISLKNIAVDESNSTYDSRNNCNAIIETTTNTLILGCQNTVIPNGVISIGDFAFQNCSGLTSVTIPEGVTSIGRSAFFDCSGLTSVTIPSSVTSIGDNAFWGCSGLTSVTIPSSVTSIGDDAFWACSGLTSVTIPSSVTSIGNGAFGNCDGLTNVTINSNSVMSNNYSYYTNASLKSYFGNLIRNYIIGNGVTSIGNCAFNGCSGLASVTIPASVTSIGDYAFNGCSGLTSVTIPEGVTNIGSYAFRGCSGLTSVTIPEGVTSIGNYVFNDCSSLLKIIVHRGSKGLIALWQSGNDINIIDANSGENLPAPELTFISSTQTTVTAEVKPFYSEYYYWYSIRGGDVQKTFNGNILIITGLRPDKENEVRLCVQPSESMNVPCYVKLSTFKTKSLNIKVNPNVLSATSFSASGSYTEDDAEVTETQLLFENKTIAEGETIYGLDPNTYYTVTYKVKACGYTYSGSAGFRTKTLTFTTQAPKVISSGNVIVAAETNVDNEEENVGFEWRRTDWTDDFPSNTGIAYIYEGTMEGYIRNLNTDKLWKFRPYYLSDSGTYYYGDWMGLDPTNTSYFEPTVHTYAKIEVEGNTALVKGYALNGTDKIAVQGFKYWKSANKANGMSMAPAQAPTIPSSAQTVEAEGRVMEATITGLDYETEYNYVAFVKTTEGETFYGDVRSFTTGVNTSGIDTAATTDSSVEVVGIYDLQGHRKNALRPGINIVRYSDGTAKKVMIRR